MSKETKDVRNKGCNIQLFKDSPSYTDISDIPVTLIAAIGTNYIIADKNGMMPWYIPSDLKHFYHTTKNSVVIMGGNTFATFGFKPLFSRYNIIVTGSVKKKITIEDWYNSDIICVANSIRKAYRKAQIYAQEYGLPIYLIGGKSLYEQFLDDNLVSSLLITRVQNKMKEGYLFDPIIHTPINPYWEWNRVYQIPPKSISPFDTHKYTIEMYSKKKLMNKDYPKY